MIKRQTVYRSDFTDYEGTLVSEASTLGLPVGEWPEVLECMGRDFTRGCCLPRKAGVVYVAKDTEAPYCMHIFND